MSRDFVEDSRFDRFAEGFDDDFSDDFDDDFDDDFAEDIEATTEEAAPADEMEDDFSEQQDYVPEIVPEVEEVAEEVTEEPAEEVEEPAQEEAAQEAEEAAPASDYDEAAAWEQISAMVMQTKRAISGGAYFRANQLINTMRDILVELVCRRHGITDNFYDELDNISDEEKAIITATYPRAFESDELCRAMAAIMEATIRLTIL